MSSAHIMGSQGRQNLLFGYDQNEIQGIGLPSYISQPPPPGRPLLTEQENDQMQDFFSSMAGDVQAHGHQLTGEHFQENMGQLHPIQMPNAYVGHETFMHSSQAMEWHTPQMPSFQFGLPMNHMSTMQPPTSPFTANGHLLSPTAPMFHGQPQPSLQTFTHSWQQQFPSHPMPSPRTDMQFGSDPHFMNTGYAAPDGTMEADLSLISYAMQPTSSASNTQPNSRPGSNANTEPSSPVTTKKRKLNVFQTDSLRMTAGSGNAANGAPAQAGSPPPASSRKQRKSFVKHERPPTPVSKTPTTYEEEEDADPEEDAEYDEDEGGDQPPSPPAPWPASKARPAHKPAPPPKPAKPRKKSTASGASAKPKPARRQSTGLINTVARVPLTAEQKKANHTNSEQRRRDATSRAYADLYDLVPEIEEGGKQSTMKKMGIVVAKVQSVTDRLKYLRQLTGRDPDTGKILPQQIAQHQYGGNMSHLSGWQ